MKEAIEEGLQFFGEVVKEVVYHYCEVKFNVNREELPRRLDVLAFCLGEVFADLAKVVEDLILTKLSAKLDVNLKGKKLRELLEHLGPP
ncbi:MAG: hypothetical protein DRJ97_05890 [Thermoprotei archaeon]|nr:MAG: hypothetical protein DRJ97_05890 [Thermoprotei archaeon]